MLDEKIVVYCICDEVWKAFNIKDDPQCKMSALYYGCNYQRTRLFSRALKYFPKILSLSQLVRRIHCIPYPVWMMVFYALQLFLRNKTKNIFIIDSFPVMAYQNHKSFRARIFSDKEFHGYTASKKQYFFGIKVHMVVDLNGVPIEFLFTPASTSDVSALKLFEMNLPLNSLLLGDRAYTNYSFENMLKSMRGIHLLAKRKSNHKRQHSKQEDALIKKHRNRIETVFSSITSRMRKTNKSKN